MGHLFRIKDRALVLIAAVCILAGCAVQETTVRHRPGDSGRDLRMVESLSMLNRVSWGASASSFDQFMELGMDAYLERQLRPGATSLPPAAQAKIDAMTISQRSIEDIVQDMERRRKAVQLFPSPELSKDAGAAYQREMNRLADQAATRFLLRAVHSPNQLLEQMTWFWMNHFNVFHRHSNLRAMIGDYEERAIRPHALGKFRDLLAATSRHPAMLRYLNNEQNAVNRINENYARELMELHTLGVNGGYSQQDVQELARILTGVGINLGTGMPTVRANLQGEYVRDGLFEFNPNRHDYGKKTFLGEPVRARGLGELDEAIDRLSRHPATALYISRKLAVYFVSDQPPAALVERMARAFRDSDGEIAATLRVMFRSGEFAESLGRKFKDPLHYLVSMMRWGYDGQPVANAGPMLGWLARMGQPLYGRQTPDGYPLTAEGWNSPAQMVARFDVAREIAGGRAPLSGIAKPDQKLAVVPPDMRNRLFEQYLRKTLAPATTRALGEARSVQEWNTFLLSSPEMMHR
jgi:uncharacterized protein (DUF1800 family)